MSSEMSMTHVNFQQNQSKTVEGVAHPLSNCLVQFAKKLKNDLNDILRKCYNNQDKTGRIMNTKNIPVYGCLC